MRKLSILACGTLLLSGALMAQIDTDASSRFDDIVAHLGLTESQLTCLEDNQDAFRDTAAPIAESLRTAQRNLRIAARNGEDTTAIQTEIDGLVAQLESLRTTYVSSARGCLDSAQQAQLGDLVAAETLMQEVRQSIGLLLIESTEEHTSGFGGGPHGGRGGPGRR